MTNAYSKLEHFIRDEMRMSHIYQPVMLMELLRSQGSASVNQIAKVLLAHDTSQVEYYEQITKNCSPSAPMSPECGCELRSVLVSS